MEKLDHQGFRILNKGNTAGSRKITWFLIIIYIIMVAILLF